jgi:hypothetical protein
MVQRTGVEGIRETGRPAMGVKVMNIRGEDSVAAVALVVERDAETSAAVAEPEDGEPPTGEPPTGEASPAAEVDGAGEPPSPDGDGRA